MTSSTIRRTGFQSSLSLSPGYNANIFCHSLNGGVKFAVIIKGVPGNCWENFKRNSQLLAISTRSNGKYK